MTQQHDLTPALIRKIRKEVAERDAELPFRLENKKLFSLQHFAELTGVKRDTVTDWECGKRNPAKAHRKRILELAISVQQERSRRQDEIRI